MFVCSRIPAPSIKDLGARLCEEIQKCRAFIFSVSQSQATGPVRSGAGGGGESVCRGVLGIPLFEIKKTFLKLPVCLLFVFSCYLFICVCFASCFCVPCFLLLYLYFKKYYRHVGFHNKCKFGMSICTKPIFVYNTFPHLFYC